MLIPKSRRPNGATSNVVADDESLLGPKVENFDKPGSEIAPDANIWRFYVQETNLADKELCEDWDKSLDVILIFAALFSAISTAFILESMKKLQPDPAGISALALLNISHVLIAVANNQTGLLPPASVGSDEFIPSSASILVNALWLASLSISVGVSLMAMLAKKWCHRFLSGRSGPFHEQARRRQKRWDGIVQWKMQGIMDALPLLMHLALGKSTLFAVGLVLYLWDINRQVATTVLAIVALFAVLYGIATCLPFISESCPYDTVLSTPLKYYISRPAKVVFCLTFSPVLVILFLIADMAILCVAKLQRYFSGFIFVGSIERDPWFMVKDLCHAIKGFGWLHDHKEDKSTIEAIPMDVVTGHILKWLALNSDDQRHISTALRAVGDTTVELPISCFRQSDIQQRVHSHLENCFIRRGPLRKLTGLKQMQHGQAAALFRSLSRLIAVDETRTYKQDQRGQWIASGLIKHDTYPLADYYSLLDEDYLDPLDSPDEFIKTSAALMPVCVWAPRFHGELNLDEVQKLVHRATRRTLSVITKHLEHDIKLHDSSLLAFLEGCRHCLVWQISKGNTGASIPEIIHAILRLLISTEDITVSLRYAIILTLCSAATALSKFNPSLGTLDSRPEDMAEKILAARLHHYKTQMSSIGQSGDDLLFYGLIGLLPLFPWASRDIWQELVSLSIPIQTLAQRAWRSYDKHIHIQGISEISWSLYTRQSVEMCITMIGTTRLPSAYAEHNLLQYLMTERSTGRYTRLLIRSVLNVLEPSTLDNRNYISAMCLAKSEEMWDYCIEFLGTSRYYVYPRPTHSEIMARCELPLRLFELAAQSDPENSPRAMLRLWRVVQRILNATFSGRNVRLQALDSLLQRDEFNDIKRAFTHDGLPATIDEMQFEAIWFQPLRDMMSARKVLEMDGGIIVEIMNHYRTLDTTTGGAKLYRGDNPYQTGKASQLQGGASRLYEKWSGLYAEFERRKAHERWIKARRILRVCYYLSPRPRGWCAPTV